jgi:hypothetical protein
VNKRFGFRFATGAAARLFGYGFKMLTGRGQLIGIDPSM